MASEQFATLKRDFFHSFSNYCFNIKADQLLMKDLVALEGQGLDSSG
jgi:hypothetical protein